MSIREEGPTQVWNVGPAQGAAVVPRALSPGSVLADRYEIVAVLGQGGMGAVYRAHDRRLNRAVAIKAFFPPPGFDEGPRRFQREFRALTRLQHPRIVAVFDYGESDGVPFYVMELIDGVDLPRLRHARGGRLPLGEVVSIGLQLCEALAYIHRQGIVHRDLKPSNVMIEGLAPVSGLPSPSSNLPLKLVDFGLAKLRDASANLTESGTLLGTINYMSPEQVQALPIDPRSDLYSLGVMLYELATGQLPFSAETPIATMLLHLNQTPPYLRSFDPSIPPEFEQIVLALLAKRPADRPSSAEVVLAKLAGFTNLAAPSIDVSLPPHADAVFQAGLMGRQSELAQLNALLDRAWSGDGCLVVVEGEAGVGKTRLATELAGQVRLRGGLRLLGTCHEAERIPYGPLAEWLDDAFRYSDDPSLFVSGLEPELARIAPRLIPIDLARPKSELDPQQAKLRLFDAVQLALVRLSRRRPLMLLLDDVQWADAATLELLHYLTRNVRGQRIFICATARSENAEALDELRRDLSRLQLYERLELARLPAEATSDLIAALLGLEQSPGELAARIYAESEGNPFFVEEILKALAEEGLLARHNGRWELQVDAQLTLLRIPSTIVDVIQRRLAHLTEAERDVLNWAAVLGHEFAYEILFPASSLNEDELLDALDSLLRGQLIAEVRDPRQDKYRFTHAKIREVAYGELSSVRRKKMHRVAGETLEKVYCNRLEEMLPGLAHHFTQGGDVPRAVHYNVQAGDRARKVYANQQAIALYWQAVELAEDKVEYANDLITAYTGLGEVHLLIGEYDQATADFRALLEMVSQPDRATPDRVHLIAYAWWGLGQANEALSDYEVALHCYDKGLANLDASDVGKRTRLLNEIAWIYIRQAEYEQARELCKRVVELAGPDSANLATAYDYMGVACRFQGDYTSAAECHQTSLALWEKVGDETQIAKELNNLGNLAELSHSYSEAIDYYQRSLVLCKEVGSSLGIAFLLNNLGVIYTGLGQMDRAYDHLQESLGIFQRIGSKEGIAIVYNNLAEIHVRQNEPQQAMDCLRRVEAILDDGSDKSTRVYMLLLMAETELLQQRLNEAEHDARRALDMIVESGMKVYEGRAQAVLGEICTQSGRSASAREHLLKASEIFETNRQLADLEQIRDRLQQLDAAAQAS